MFYGFFIKNYGFLIRIQGESIDLKYKVFFIEFLGFFVVCYMNAMPDRARWHRLRVWHLLRHGGAFENHEWLQGSHLSRGGRDWDRASITAKQASLLQEAKHIHIFIHASKEREQRDSPEICTYVEMERKRKRKRGNQLFIFWQMGGGPGPRGTKVRAFADTTRVQRPKAHVDSSRFR